MVRHCVRSPSPYLLLEHCTQEGVKQEQDEEQGQGQTQNPENVGVVRRRPRGPTRCRPPTRQQRCSRKRQSRVHSGGVRRRRRRRRVSRRRGQPRRGSARCRSGRRTARGS
ncbi:protamine-2-like [Suncus etruscus]|uniref:protamine-2-like n=1 Tax=Suncus etruscus TaxID=109475 RepID=UPI00210F4731|nr:protamine-2-like [Suncus etruscus]